MKTQILRTIFLLSALLLLQIANGQTEQIQQLEESLRSASGPKRVDILLQLSEAHQLAGNAGKAESFAEDATDFARRIKNPELRAQALNREGKVMMSRGKKKVAVKFEQSIDLLREINSPNKGLALDNLENLRKLAAQAGKQQELAALETQITFIRSGGGLSDPVPDTKQVLQQELTAVQQQLAQNQSTFQESQTKLLEESKVLQDQLAAREAVINRMTEQQMKTAMLVMQQRVLLDSISYRAGIDSLTVSNANLALREADSNRKFHFAAIGVLLLLAGGSTFSYVKAHQNSKILEEKNKTIREEQQRSEVLLLNILPSLVAEELKKKGRTDAQYFEDVSVLFADFVGFSQIAEHLSPQQLVSELDTCFQKFDDIIALHGLEKIKTIGDAYMCAGGLPNGGGAQMHSIVAAAIDMQNWLFTWNTERDKTGQPRFDARIGIHRGPVVAGVVGSRKFAFDIWGDTVNVAARIEQAGEGGRINISGEAYSVLKDDFDCRYRGKIAAKNKGEIDMYFVES